MIFLRGFTYKQIFRETRVEGKGMIQDIPGFRYAEIAIVGIR